MKTQLSGSVAILLTLALGMISACADYGAASDGPCRGVTCSGHGKCTLAGEVAACDCDSGWQWKADDALVCVESAIESVIVDLVTGLSEPVDQVVSVSLKNSLSVSLKLGTAMAAVWEDMLGLSKQHQQPVYLEIVPETRPEDRMILHLELPLVSPVHSLEPNDEGVEVQLIHSAAIHFLALAHPKFQEMLAVLEAALRDGATVVVSEKDGRGIVDVRLDNF